MHLWILLSLGHSPEPQVQVNGRFSFLSFVAFSSPLTKDLSLHRLISRYRDIQVYIIFQLPKGQAFISMSRPSMYNTPAIEDTLPLG